MSLLQLQVAPANAQTSLQKLIEKSMETIYFATFIVALLSSLLSGMASGGGGFIMAPYWLISGMSPAQGATTGAFMAIGMGGSSLAAFKGSEHTPTNRKLLTPLLVITLITSAVGPFFLQHISASSFKPFLAIMTLLSLPLLFRKRALDGATQGNHRTGLGILAILLLASSFITSSAFSLLITIVLLRYFHLTTLKSTAVRRAMGIVQSLVIFTILFALGNFIWQHALAALLGGTLGSYIGTKYALKKGEQFAKYALAASGIVSSLLLLI